MDIEVLVRVPGTDAGVYREAEGVWLAGALADGGTLLDAYQPAVEGLNGPRTVVGGLLPEGAVGAEVVDELGHRHRAAAGDGA